MTPDLDQLADEAIRVRTDHMVLGSVCPDPDLEVARRSLRLANWRHDHPALDALTVARETNLARLEAQGVTPDPGCTATAGRVTLEAVQDVPPLSHRYLILRGRDVVGTAWLSTRSATRGGYEGVTGEFGPIDGRQLSDVLTRLALRLDGAERVRQAAKRGDVQ